MSTLLANLHDSFSRNGRAPLVVALWFLFQPGWCGSQHRCSHLVPAQQHLDVEAVRRHLTILADDSLQGRGTGTAGERRAARHIEQQLIAAGVRPAGADGSYFQPIPLHGSLPLASCQFHLRIGGERIELELWQDYILQTSGAQTFIPAPTTMVFAGYGIVAPEYDYNDYQNLDVEGKIVVYLSGEPLSEDREFFDAGLPTAYSDPLLKHRIAVARGARATVMIPLPREKTYLDWDYWVHQYSFEDVRLPSGVLDRLSIFMSPEVSWLLFSEAEFGLRDVLTFDAEGGMRSFPLMAAGTFDGQFQERDFVSQNIAGLVTGSHADLKESYIVLAAHYDHLGISAPVQGDSVYNGLVDNAIGVSVLLELAKHFAQMPVPPARSLVFLFVTGEEKGLLGSRFYCDHPLVPLSKTVAAINIDGIAILDNFWSITGVGARLSSLGEVLAVVASDFNLRMTQPPAQFQQRNPYTSSDHFSFAQAGVPAILVMEGFDYCHLSEDEGRNHFADWGANIYHSPFDDLDQPINFNAVQQHSDIILAFVSKLADWFLDPQWYPDVPFASRRLQSLAENR